MDNTYIMGIYGGDNPVDEDRAMSVYDFVSGHDSNAAIIMGGQIVAAYEQERLDRIKHSNKSPMMAVRACLQKCGIDMSKVGLIAVPVMESKMDAELQSRCEHSDYWRRHWGSYRARPYLQKLLTDAFGVPIDTRSFRFVHHHQAHAALAYYTSGFEDALVVTMDGIGDNVSLLVADVRGGQWNILRSRGDMQSLGHFYSEITRYLGFAFHDEYKVMGMSSYGDPAKFRRQFRDFVHLLPDGDFIFNWQKIQQSSAYIPLRGADEYPQQIHMDFAAASQELFELIAFHVLRHYRKASGFPNVCFAGGAALNCVFNGKLLASGLFADVYVPPAAADSGLALGAALYIYHLVPGAYRRPCRMQHAYLGASITDVSSTRRELDLWSDFIEVSQEDDVASRAAQLIADGAVIGWVQGESEFGPRALGNRSILADPRPANNRTIINSKVKGREEFRPFAPAILEEHVASYFDLPTARTDYSFMAFTLPVRKECRSLLGATTHVDGSARVQTVSQEQNPQFWELIYRFFQLTGTPILLNTSFNNNYEPIVESVSDAVTSFLTCGLDYLVVGNQIVSKKEVGHGQWMQLALGRPPFIKLDQVNRKQTPRMSRLRDWGEKMGFLEKVKPAWQIRNSFKASFCQPVSEQVFRLLLYADSCRTVAELMAETHIESSSNATAAMVDELTSLWRKRLVQLTPTIAVRKISSKVHSLPAKPSEIFVC